MRGVATNWNGYVKFVTSLSPKVRNLRAENLLLPATSVSATESFYQKIGTLDSPTTQCICRGMRSGACVIKDKWLKTWPDKVERVQDFSKTFIPPNTHNRTQKTTKFFFPMSIFPKGKIWDILQLYEVV